MDGGDGCSGSMQYGGAREEGIGVSTGVRVTIFAAGVKPQENTNKKEEQQTTKKKLRQREKSATRRLVTRALPIRNQQSKIVEMDPYLRSENS